MTNEERKISPALTLAHERWNVRANVRCPGCQPGEWYGVPTHERHCPLAATWYVTPPRASGPIDVLLALAREVDPGHTAHPLQSWRAREKMTAVNYLVRAAWRVYNSGG